MWIGSNSEKNTHMFRWRRCSRRVIAMRMMMMIYVWRAPRGSGGTGCTTTGGGCGGEERGWELECGTATHLREECSCAIVIAIIAVIEWNRGLDGWGTEFELTDQVLYFWSSWRGCMVWMDNFFESFHFGVFWPFGLWSWVVGGNGFVVSFVFGLGHEGGKIFCVFFRFLKM